MLSNDYIGRVGRLGNQMFQYTAVKGIATHRGYEYCIPPEHEMLTEGFLMSNVKHRLFCNFTEGRGEEHFHFNERLFNECPDNVNLGGYFQSWKYFDHCAQEVREDFTLRPEYDTVAKEYIQKMKAQYGDDIIAICVRRGDYIHYPEHHPILPMHYYEAALRQFRDDQHVIIVSDEKDWCANEPLFQHERFHISPVEHNHWVDMGVLAGCDYHIIANSTYSWWGTWLSSQKQVVAPIQWFGTALAHVDTSDLTPHSWTRL